MSRNILWILTVFLSLAMIALVGVQAYWIKNSIDAKEQQLGLLVRQVLEDISSELAREETIAAIIEEIRPPMIQNQHNTYLSVKVTGSVDEADEESDIVYEAISVEGDINLRASESEDHDADQDWEISEEPESRPDRDAAEIYFHGKDSALKNTQIKIVDDTVIVVLAEDESIQDTVLVSTMHPEQVRTKLIRRWEEQELLVNKIVKQMLTKGEHIEDRISEKELTDLLRLKLTEKAVDIPFEFAVYVEGKPPIYASEDFNEYEECTYYRSNLFGESIFHTTTLISVYFPGEKSHIRKSIGLMSGTSALITLSIFSLFSLALFIMFKQRRLSEMKNDFVNNMTHELKTPISTISLASQMLSDRSIPNEQKNLGQISRIIQSESRQLGFQVERVLQMAIFDHGQLKLKQEEVDVHEIIETVAQNFLLQLNKRGGKLEFNPEAEESIVMGDAMHITNVISNLLENAAKYSKQTPMIVLGTKLEKENLVVSVSDNGIGISKEHQKRIFDKFYRVPTGNVHNVKGFGLGLSYVKLIIDEHQGDIRIKSEAGKGSTFDIVLPLYKTPTT